MHTLKSSSPLKREFFDKLISVRLWSSEVKPETSGRFVIFKELRLSIVCFLLAHFIKVLAATSSRIDET